MHPYPFDARREIAQFVPSCARLLDVGCSSGGFVADLRQRRTDIGEAWGIEANPEAATTAKAHLDHVITGLFPDDLPTGDAFDVVVFNDVLEHMVDPWAALIHTRQLLRPGGRVVASIPNIRHWSIMMNLAVRGRWTYTETGILDKTHLRFFTKSSIIDLFHACGYEVETIAGVNDYAVQGGRPYVRLLPHDVRWLQYAVVAAPARSVPTSRSRGAASVVGTMSAAHEEPATGSGTED